MTPDGVYIIISSRTKPPHWFPHFCTWYSIALGDCVSDLCEWCGCISWLKKERYLAFNSIDNKSSQDWKLQIGQRWSWCVDLLQISFILFLILDSLPTDFLLVQIEGEGIEYFLYVITGRMFSFLYHWIPFKWNILCDWWTMSFL